MNLILVGPQGSGKGAQAERLKREFNLAYLSTGEILRELAKQDSPKGREVNKIINKEGKIVSDQFTIDLVEETLEKIDWKGGLLFDGYPRGLVQFEALDRYFIDKGQKIDKVIYLEISDQTAIKRLSSRRICEQCGAVYNLVTDPSKSFGICDKCGGKLIQRVDDTLQVIKRRLAEYHRLTEPIIAAARRKGILIEIDAEPPIEIVFKSILAKLS